MVNIYILELENNKYYIGKSNNLNDRIMDHLDQKGSEYTKLYKPIRLIEIKYDCDDFDEDKYTLEYMEKYGINNVRGGSFSELQISDENMVVITKMINSAQNRCFICGSKEHYANKCNNKKKCSICESNYHLSNDCKSRLRCECLSCYVFPHPYYKCIHKNFLNIIKYF